MTHVPDRDDDDDDDDDDDEGMSVLHNIIQGHEKALYVSLFCSIVSVLPQQTWHNTCYF